MNKDLFKDVAGQTEDALQQKCVFWFHNAYPDLRGMLFSVPNGGRRDKREAFRLKQTGLIPGVSDLILLCKGSAYLIELKNDDGQLRPIQKEWRDKARDQDIEYYVVNRLEMFKVLIKNIVG